MKLKKIAVPATANNLNKGVKNQIIADGGYAWRINVVGLPFDPITFQGTKYFRLRNVSQTDTGISDVLAVYKGRFIAIETKTTDKQRADQIRFQKEVEKSGGIYYICDNWNEFLLWWNNLKNIL